MFDFIYRVFSHVIWQRQQYLIKKDFQLRYIGLLIGFASIICLIFIVATKYYININLGALIDSGLISSDMATQLIHLEKGILYKNLLTIFLILIVTITGIGIFITHRIAGPIFALERRMKQISREGIQSTEFRVRRTDEFQELIEAFNDMIISLQKQTQINSEKLDQIYRSLEPIVKNLENGRSDKKDLQELHKIQGWISESLGTQNPEYKKAA